MKVNNIIFTTFSTILAVASLGFAIPAPSNKTTVDALPAGISTNEVDAVNQLDAVINSGGIGDLSDSCKNALLQIVASPEFLKCVPPTSLVPLIPIGADPTIIPKVLADPVKNYKPLLEQPLLQFATEFCKAPKCSDKGVKGAIDLVKAQCKDDFAKKNDFINLVFTLMVLYSPARDSVCFKGDKTFCFDETILTIISLPPSNFPITKNPLQDSIIVSDPFAMCTKCNKNMLNTGLNFISQNAKDQDVQAVLQSLGVTDDLLNKFKLGVAVKCGQNFEDGKVTP